MSGATCGSGGGVGPDEKEGRLTPLHAPRKTASAEAIPRLTTVRVLIDLIMISPERKSLTASSRSQAQNCCRSNDVQLMTPALRFGFDQHPIPASPRT